MRTINLSAIPERARKSPKGRFQVLTKEISVALGREAHSTDALKQHPFDIALVRVPPLATNFPYHLHTAQTEFYLIVSGQGLVRDETGTHEVGPGDAFLFPPNHPHQITNPTDQDLTFYVIADNPAGEACYYPDSKKWLVRRGQERSTGTIKELDYFHGEE